MNPTPVLAAALLVLGLAAPLHAQPAGPASPWDLTGAQTYSDVCLNKETSIPHGLRVFVRPVGAEPRIVVQPVLVELLAPVAAQVRTVKGRLIFTSKGDTPATSFKGEIVDGHAVVTSLAPYARTKRVPLRDDSRGFPDCP